MTTLGKVFILESHPEHLNAEAEAFEEMGFTIFSTDNIYLLLRYATEVRPDIVIMNFPDDFNADSQTWQDLQDHLCRQGSCPKIYTNAAANVKDGQTFQHASFRSRELEKQDILEILSRTRH